MRLSSTACTPKPDGPRCSGEVVASTLARSAVLDAQRRDAKGTAGLQPAVAMVRGLEPDDSIRDVRVFTKNRERLLEGDIDETFFQAVVQQAYFPNTSFSSVCVVAESRLSLTSTVSA